MTKENNILRRTRFDRAQDESTSDFLSSMDQDYKILEADIWVDKVHVLMLDKQNIISTEHAIPILKALESIASIDSSRLGTRGFEDVHVFLETELIKRLGDSTGGRLHTARSRNDEVATCIRISLRDDLLITLEAVTRLQGTLLELASGNLTTIMPGYTHLQHAQPTTLAHHLMAYAFALQRDISRLMGCYELVNVSPLGAGAMSSTSFPIDPNLTARLLAFNGVAENSIDAVASRDFIVEALSCFSILGVNLSRLIEEIILWSTAEFGFVQLADEYSSTSSIMPQKRNPDVAELARGRISSLFGSLFSALSICKSLPLSYNRDLQEVTAHLWRGTETMKSILPILNGILSTISINKEAMKDGADRGLPWATDLADLLVSEFDLPFRTAHSVVAEVAKHWEEGKEPENVSQEIAKASKEISGKEILLEECKIREVMDVQSRIRLKRVCGGPSPSEVEKSILNLKKTVKKNESWIDGNRKRIKLAKEEVVALQAALDH